MHFFLLIGISSIHSDRVILAMKDYLVGGTPVRRSARNTR
nr:PapB/FocB family fimbrial expression transcriptional regulator [Escherichia coli]